MAVVSPINSISVQAPDSSVREFILSLLSDVAGFGNDLHIVELYVKVRGYITILLALIIIMSVLAFVVYLSYARHNFVHMIMLSKFRL